jgi:hypothetical protein
LITDLARTILIVFLVLPVDSLSYGYVKASLPGSGSGSRSFPHSSWQADFSPQGPPGNQKPQTKPEARTTESKTRAAEAALLEAQRRAFAISIVMSLADEARSYRDLALRPRVIAQAADTLWDADNDAARTLFRRAWDAAEKADAEDGPTSQTKDGSPAMLIVVSSNDGTGGDSRAEVLTLAARRDRALGEEFLAKLTADTEREVGETNSGSSAQRANNSWSASPAASKRLLLAHRLLDENEIERALEFAAPVLLEVNERTIRFLTALRLKRPDLADQRFMLLLARCELDPSSDANTVSGLSTYAFTPGFYVTFSATGSVSLNPAAGPIAPPELPGVVRNRFFQVAANILLRPLLPPNRDFTSAGRTGKYMVIKRLLPLFDQYAPDTAVALRSQLAALSADPSVSLVDDDDFLVRQGLEREVGPANALENMQDRLDHASTSRERDVIYTDAAAVLASKGDARAQDLANKIDNAEWRARVLEFVDLSLVQFAIGRNDGPSVAGLAKTGALSHTQRAWAYAQASRLLIKAERGRALDLLEEALAEAQRIDTNDPNRACMLIAVATQFLNSDQARAWGIMGDAIKAANAVPEFNGEDAGLNFVLATASGLKFIKINGAEFSLERMLRLLTRDDLIRADGLAKSFKNEAARAVATLAIARAVLEKSK